MTSVDFDLLPFNIVVYKKQQDDFLVCFLNKAIQQTEQLDCDAVLGSKVTQFIPEIKESGLFDAMLRVQLSGESELIYTAYNTIDGEKLWRQNQLIKLPDATLAIFSNRCGLKNHSFLLEQELNEAEILLEHQKKMFQHIMENSESISVQGYNEDHEVIYWNKASEKLYGFSKEEAYGQKLESLIIPQPMREYVYELIEEWLHKGVSVPSSELVLVDKSGNDVTVFSQHMMIKVDTRHYEMYCVDIDLKELKQLQKELVTQRNFLRTILDVVPDLIWLKDTEGNYLACNKTFERFAGAKESDIISGISLDIQSTAVAIDNQSYTLHPSRSCIDVDYLSFADNSHKGLFETIKTPMLDTEGNIIGILGVSRDITEYKEREQQLKTYAHFDVLTGLANRVLFMERLTQFTQTGESLDSSCALFFIDLDRFKEINDTKGHSVGDEIIVLVAQRLKKTFCQGDTLARFGGDEFIVLLEQTKTSVEATEVAQSILDTLREPFVIGQNQFYLTASIGITLYPDDSIEPENLLSFADIALYKAKENGRNNYEFYTEDFSKQALEKVKLENNLRRAITNNEFVLYYQPQINALNNQIIGAEALIRWNDPQFGLISPYQFITAAEDSGQIIEIGHWVIYQAMKDIKHWKEIGVAIETVSINLSVKQLNDENLMNIIQQALNQTQCDPKWVEFEVTEGYAMKEPEQAIVLLEKIRDLGCKLSIDDFGTGYSSLAYLKRLPVKKLKIDQSFVRDIPGDSDDEAIVKAVILIAESMQLEVIAEGVEEERQQAFLSKHGCKYSQGYLYAKPMPITEFEAYLQLNITQH